MTPRTPDLAPRTVGRLGALLLAGLVLLSVFLAWQQRRQALAQAERLLQSQATALAAHAGEVMSAATFVLAGVADRAAGAGDAAGLRERFAGSAGHAWLRARQQSFRPVAMVSVFDDRAWLLAMSREHPAPPIRIADRESFLVPARGETRPHVTLPSRNRYDGRWTFFLTQRLATPDGRFLGAAQIGLDSDHFTRFYQSALTPAAGAAGSRPGYTAALVRLPDEAVLARSPPDEARLGQRLPAPGEAGVPLLRARSSVGAQPMAVVVEVDEDTALVQWRRQARVTGAFIGLAALLLAASFLLLTRGLERRERQLRDMTRLREAAEAANRAKSEFLATMSHEIRTPMNGILGTAELLLRQPLGPHESRLAHTLLRSGRHLLALLDDVLDLSKIEAGELRLHGAPFAPAALVHEVREMFTPLAADKGLALEATIAPDVPRAVLGDELRVRQVLANLVGNAVKFTDRGGVHVEVVALPAAEGAHRRLRWSVHDSGIGIPPERGGELFQAFRQIDGSPQRRAGGTGLGLALCLRLVRLMGGTIGFDSQPGQGSRFWFELELAPSDAPLAEAPAPAPARAPAAAASTPGTATPVVLVVEDNPVNAIVLEAQLQHLGCHAVVATDGEEALQRLNGERFDLVFLDCMLPGISGYEVAEQWRALETAAGKRRTPIVALTANALESNVERCRRAGMDDFLTKPCGADTLRQALQRWLPRAAASIAP